MTSYGPRHHKRKLYTKASSKKGILNILKKARDEYNINDKVVVLLDSAYHKGIPHFRYHGKIGFVLGKRGNCYLVNISGPSKLLITNKYHLKLANGV